MMSRSSWTPAITAKILAELIARGGCTTWKLRQELAQKAFARTAVYDAAISNWLAAEMGLAAPAYRAFGGKLALTCVMARTRIRPPRSMRRESHVAESRPRLQVQGKELSYNNVNDTDAAFELVAEFDPGRTAACRDHQARQSLRRRRGGKSGHGL